MRWCLDGCRPDKLDLERNEAGCHPAGNWPGRVAALARVRSSKQARERHAERTECCSSGLHPHHSPAAGRAPSPGAGFPPHRPSHQGQRGFDMSYPRTETCRKRKHAFVHESGRVCSRCGIRRSRMPGSPRLIPLQYGEVYCELCTNNIQAGERVAWWSLGRRLAAYCPDCHHANITEIREGRASGPLRRGR